MAALSETQLIEILIIIRSGYKTRTRQEICDLFKTKYPNRPISCSTFSEIKKKFWETGYVKHISVAERP